MTTPNDSIGGLEQMHPGLCQEHNVLEYPYQSEIAIISFHHQVNVVQDFVTADEFQPTTLTASGGTGVAGAVLQAFDILDQRKREYRANGIAYFQPMAFLVTDRYPEHDTPEAIAEATIRIREQEDGRHAAFLPPASMARI